MDYDIFVFGHGTTRYVTLVRYSYGVVCLARVLREKDDKVGV